MLASVRFVIDIEPTADGRATGRVSGPEGATELFEGWLELMRILEGRLPALTHADSEKGT